LAPTRRRWLSEPGHERAYRGGETPGAEEKCKASATDPRNTKLTANQGVNDDTKASAASGRSPGPDSRPRRTQTPRTQTNASRAEPGGWEQDKEGVSKVPEPARAERQKALPKEGPAVKRAVTGE